MQFSAVKICDHVITGLVVHLISLHLSSFIDQMVNKNKNKTIPHQIFNTLILNNAFSFPLSTVVDKRLT